MINGTQKYRFYGSLDGGDDYTELFLNNYPKISNKPETNEIFYRVKSDSWTIQSRKNQDFYNELLYLVKNPCSVIYDILFQCRTESEVLYTGALKINNVTEVHEPEGVITVAPTTVDDYTWWDKDKDTVSVVSPSANIVQYSATSIEYALVVEVAGSTGELPIYGGMVECSIVTGNPRIVTYKQQRLPFSYTGYSQGNGVFGEGNSPYTTNCPENMFYKSTCDVETIPDTTLGTSFFRLDEIIESVTDDLDNSLDIVSNFLNDSTNPVTGSNNDFNNVLIGLIADVTGDQGVDREYTFDGLMDIIKKWQCYWWIEGTDLRIEHIKTINEARTDGIDLTTGVYNSRKYLTLQNINEGITDTVYSFKIDAQIKEQFSYDEGDDRIGTIEYTSPLAEEKTKKHELRGFMADVNKLISFPDSLSEDNYIILLTDLVSSDTYKIRSEVSGTGTFLNKGLTWDRILNRYWIHNRPFYTGRINGGSVSFLSLQHMKVQKELSFPDLDGIYDPTKYIITNLGDGIIDSIELDTDNGFITTTLKYKHCG